MRAVARVVAEPDGRGGTRLARLRSEAPLVLRATPEAVYLVGGAGGPLGGDDLAVEIEVGPGADLTVRSAAASVAQPGHRPGPSRLRVRADVGAGGTLRWMPEPLVAAAGCDHRMDATLDVAGTGRVVWWEELVLGRHRQPSGTLTSRLHVDVDGAPLLRHEVGLGPGYPHAAGPAIVGAARAVGSVLLVNPLRGPDRMPTTATGPTAAVLALDGPGVQVVALAPDALALRRMLEAALPEAARRVWPVTLRGTNAAC